MNLPLADTDAAAVAAVELQTGRCDTTDSAASSTSWEDAATGRSPESGSPQFADGTAKTPDSGMTGQIAAGGLGEERVERILIFGAEPDFRKLSVAHSG